MSNISIKSFVYILCKGVLKSVATARNFEVANYGAHRQPVLPFSDIKIVLTMKNDRPVLQLTVSCLH